MLQRIPDHLNQFGIFDSQMKNYGLRSRPWHVGMSSLGFRSRIFEKAFDQRISFGCLKNMPIQFSVETSSIMAFTAAQEVDSSPEQLHLSNNFGDWLNYAAIVCGSNYGFKFLNMFNGILRRRKAVFCASSIIFAFGRIQCDEHFAQRLT